MNEAMTGKFQREEAQTSEQTNCDRRETLNTFAEAADAKRLLSSLLETAPDAMLIVDQHGAILLANAQAESMFGYSHDQLAGKPLAMLIPARFRNIHAEQRNRFFSMPRLRPMGTGLNLCAVRRDGCEFPVDISLSPIETATGVLVVSAIRDISDRKRIEQELRRANEELDKRVLERTAELEAVTRELRKRVEIQEQTERELRQSEERFRLLVEGTRDYAIFMLDPGGVVASWNIGAERIFGYTAEEAIGRSLAELHTNEDSHFLAPHYVLEQAAHGGRFEEEAWRTAKNGRRFLASTVTTALRDDYGHLRGFSRITRDVTEKHGLEQQLRHAHKLEAIGRLAGGIAHEFNNSATAILGYSALILDKVQDEKLQHFAEEIHKAGKRAAAVTRQLLAFSRQQVLQPAMINLNDVVTDVEKMLRQLIEENIRVVTVLDPYLGSVKADPGGMAQVIVNLALNARDAMPEGGELLIETGNVDLGSDIAAEMQQVIPGANVLLRVSDTGTGLDNQAKGHLFEPFFTTKPVGSGTGLGLSTVYGIVKQSGGGIRVFSEPGHGTTFEIYFPRQQEVAVRPALISSGKNANGGSETILVVEDDSSLRWLTSQILSQFGYKVVTASDVTSALKVVGERANDLDLVITDVVMPRHSGRQLARQLAELYPKIKVLLMSGHMAEIVQRDLKEIAVPFLDKPFTPEMLAAKVREVLDQEHPSHPRKGACVANVSGSEGEA